METLISPEMSGGNVIKQPVVKALINLGLK
jgi:hypothetical protein